MIGKAVGYRYLDRTGFQPALNLGPEILFGICPRQNTDMAGIENIELLVLAPNQAHDGLSLRQGTDMILFSGDIEDRTANIREVYSPPPQHDLTLYQLILLIKL